MLAGEIQEMMAVARASWKADAGARPNGFATRFRHSHKLALKHVKRTRPVWNACVAPTTAHRAKPEQD
jgi:hypothetical protein